MVLIKHIMSRRGGGGGGGGWVMKHTYILPVSALRHPYTSPKPPLPMIRCTLKSFIVNYRGDDIIVVMMS